MFNFAGGAGGCGRLRELHYSTRAAPHAHHPKRGVREHYLSKGNNLPPPQNYEHENGSKNGGIPPPLRTNLPHFLTVRTIQFIRKNIMQKLNLTFTLPANTTRTESAHADVFRFASGGLVTILHSPDGANQQPVIDAVSCLVRYNSGKQAILDDAHLSQTGRDAKIQNWEIVEGLRLKQEMERFAEIVQSQADDTNRANAKLYSATKLEPNDAVSAINDNVIVDWMTSLPASELAKQLKTLQDGTMPRQVVALMRRSELIPLPAAIDAVVPDAWRASVQKLHPVACREMEQRIAVSEWQVQSIAAIAQHVPQLAGARRLAA